MSLTLSLPKLGRGLWPRGPSEGGGSGLLLGPRGGVAPSALEVQEARSAGKGTSLMTSCLAQGASSARGARGLVVLRRVPFQFNRTKKVWSPNRPIITYLKCESKKIYRDMGLRWGKYYPHRYVPVPMSQELLVLVVMYIYVHPGTLVPGFDPGVALVFFCRPLHKKRT